MSDNNSTVYPAVQDDSNQPDNNNPATIVIPADDDNDNNHIAPSSSETASVRDSARSKVVITEEDRLLAQRLLGNRSSVQRTDGHGRPMSARVDYNTPGASNTRPLSVRSNNDPYSNTVGNRSSVRSEVGPDGLTSEQHALLQSLDPSIRAEVEADMRAQLNRRSVQSSPGPSQTRNRVVSNDYPVAAYVGDEQNSNGNNRLSGVTHVSEDGRVLLTKHEEHNGRPASVTVELGPDGHVKAIVSGTAQLPGETRQHYMRQMSSFAIDQLRDIPLKVGISWHGGQKYAYFCILVVIVTGFVLMGEFAENDWQMEDFSKNPTAGPSAEVLLNMGAKRTDLIRQGQFYRLIAPIFLHGGILHWLFNMIGLYSMGFPMEKEFGSPKIAIIYFVSGFVGVLTSAVFSPFKIGVGASGAIFGLFGAAWADLIQNWGLYKTRKAAISTLIQLVFSTILNIMIGFAPFLDAFAHLGGMICGVFLGFTLLLERRYTRFAEAKDFKTKHRLLQLAGILSTPVATIILLIWLYTAQDPNSWCSWCKYIDCIPVQDLWTCDDCTDAGLSGEAFVNQTITVTCPITGQQVWGNITKNWKQATTADLLVLCKAKCFKSAG
jgi:membrane associated rhomboid family serine protease